MPTSPVSTPAPTAATDKPALLSLRGVNKSFGAVHVLQGVDLDCYPGEVTALVGDNGAGKSTLIKGIAGIHAFDSGSYEFEGKQVSVHNPKQANALGIEVVYQDLALCDNLDIVHNLFLGREITKGGRLDHENAEHHHRCDHVRGRRGPATTRRKQVRERVIREQLVPVLSEKSEHRPRRQHVPSEHTDIQQLTLTIITTLHESSLKHANPNRSQARLKRPDKSAGS